MKVNLVLLLLEHLKDGSPRFCDDIERSLQHAGQPLSVTCGVGGTLLQMSDWGFVTELTGKYDWFGITEKGRARIEELRREEQSQAQEAARPKLKQTALFA